MRWTGSAALSAITAVFAFVTLSTADEATHLNSRSNAASSLDSKLAYTRFAGENAGQERDDNGLKLKFVWCPPGLFTMENRFGTEMHLVRPMPVEKPENDDVAIDDLTEAIFVDARITVQPVRVFLKRGYWLGKYEVTRAEWQDVMHTEPWANRKIAVEGRDFPATYVSWNDATEFCRRLTAEERKVGRLPVGWEYTLPTDAQWERACRANSKTEFSFGDDQSVLGDYAWFRGNTRGRGEPFPHQVGQKKPNQWGLFDMHGNALEWCRDWWGTVPGGIEPETTQANPMWPNKVQRGGDSSRDAPACRSSARDMSAPELRKSEFGFRVALSTVH